MSAAVRLPAPTESIGAREKFDTSRCPRWTPEEDEQMRLMAASGHTKQDVADALGRTINAVAARAMATRVKFRSLRRASEQPVIFRRRCLRCRNLFDAESRWRFICDVCHLSDAWRGYDLAPWWRGTVAADEAEDAG